ncbi:pectinesterase 3 [Punica granatum]|uniref:pectinesterase n=2 Tax=Punica granatum TaxID=22663 RepID=A0A218VY17_PUNGR|nr:pectinesterase 3 [Punica granatum]OWM65316.1 hypothetical protein CDL15_Pgr008906 [Punica granatum]PKI63234.1 hypothetical protein CRG98_016419 [Punica granatum]
MDSINFLKGYGKVNPADQHPPQHPPRPARRSLLLAVSLSALLLLTLTLGLLLGAVVHDSAAEPAESSSLASNLTESIRAVCGVTQHPDSCFSSLSSLNCSIRPDPESIFKLSVTASLKQLSNASLFVKQLKESSNDVHSNGALEDCATQLEDALSRLNDCASAMGTGSGENVLTEVKISNIQTWVSAAMTDQETCLDGLEEMGSAVLDEIRAKLQGSKESMGNSLAIVAHMKDLREKFNMD